MSAFGEDTDIGVGVSDTALLVVSVAGFVLLSISTFHTSCICSSRALSLIRPLHSGIYSVVMVNLKTFEELEEEDGDLDPDERLLARNVATLSRPERRARAKLLRKQQEKANDNDNLTKKERLKKAREIERLERKVLQEEREIQHREAQRAAQRQKQLRLERLRHEKEREEQRRIQEEAEKELAFQTFLSTDGGRRLTVDEWRTQLDKELVVDLQTLAEDYETSQQAVKNRIKQLVREQRICGVFMPNGRFVSFDSGQLERVLNAVRQKGEASAHEVAEIMTQILQSS